MCGARGTHTNDAINKTWHISCARTVEVRSEKMASRFFHIGNKNVLSHRNGTANSNGREKVFCDRPDGVMWPRCVSARISICDGRVSVKSLTSDADPREMTLRLASVFPLFVTFLGVRVCVLARVHFAPELRAHVSLFTRKHSLNTLRFDHNLINLFYNFHQLLCI